MLESLRKQYPKPKYWNGGRGSVVYCAREVRPARDFQRYCWQVFVGIAVAHVLLDNSWRKVNAPIETADLDQKWKNDIAQGARVLLKETYVKANDPHMGILTAHLGAPSG